jgi:hypothetical protein
MNCKWLPDFYPKPDWSNYPLYEDELYTFFRSLYLDKKLFFLGKPISYRYAPYENGKEEVFYHLTCKKHEGKTIRDPDPERIIRIEWTKAYIENHVCIDSCCTDKPLYWIDDKRKHKIFFNNFIVILEERKDKFMLVTAFYIESKNYKVGLKKEHARFTKSKERH